MRRASVLALSFGLALASSAVAPAAPFVHNGAYQGAGGLPGYTAGDGLTVDRGGFFDAPFSFNVTPASAAIFPFNPWLEFDSYMAVDPFGPSARGAVTDPQFNSDATRAFYGDYPALSDSTGNYTTPEGRTVHAAPGTHIGDPNAGANPQTPYNRVRGGITVNAPQVPSGFAPNPGGGRGTLDGQFVGRFTVERGAIISGDFEMILTQGQPSHRNVLEVNGAPKLFEIAPGVFQPMALRLYLVAQPTITQPGLADPRGHMGQNFGEADVYDLWFQAVPGPGSGTLLLLAGLTAARRRHS